MLQLFIQLAGADVETGIFADVNPCVQSLVVNTQMNAKHRDKPGGKHSLVVVYLW